MAYNQASNSLIDRPLNLRPGLGLFYFKNKYFIYGLYKKIFMSENGKDWQEYTNTEMPDKIDQIANFSMWKYNDKLYGAFFKCFERTDVDNVYFRVMYSYDGLSWYKLFEEKTDKTVVHYCPIWCVYKNDQNVPYLYFYKDGVKLTYMAKYALTFNKNKQTQKRDQVCGYQRRGQGKRELDEGSQKVQTSSYKINKYWGYNVRHG